MSVRPARADDLPELIRLAAVMFASVGLDAAADAWRAAGRVRVADGLADGSVAGFVVEQPAGGGALAAAALATICRRLPTPSNPGGLVAYVQWVATDPAHRRRGHARAVMEALVVWARDAGAGSVDLHASGDGEPLYRAMGFAEHRNPELRLPLTR
ncbi:MAG: GNAT family N-acetyltransferase [Acidimicrobiia bacterium]